MRSRKAFINTIASLGFELVSIISAFLLPRLIIGSFGSATNGITQASTQFISYISLLSAGLGGVTRAALFRPLQENDEERISSIINATENFLRKISRIFILALTIFAFIFPLFVIKEFDYWFTVSLVFIMGIGTFANYYFGITYRILLQADQKQYVINLVQTVVLIVNTIVLVLMINSGFNIHLVKLASTIIFLFNPIVIFIIVRRKYKINRNIAPDYTTINQRWDAFYHQIAGFVNENTDLVLLIIFASASEVSVYTVYFLIFNGIKRIIVSTITGIEAAFGNMIAKNETESINRNIKLYEFFIHTIAILAYSSMGLLIISFIEQYIKGIDDVNYIRHLFGYIISTIGFFSAARIPYEALTRAAGHFKQTRNGAIFEATMNIVLSVALVIPFGMVGLVIGTLASTIFRTIQYSVYSSKNLLNRSLKVVFKRYAISLFNVVTIVLIVYFLPTLKVDSYFDWIINALIVVGVGIITTIIYSLIFYFDDFVNTKNFVLRVFGIKTVDTKK